MPVIKYGPLTETNDSYAKKDKMNKWRIPHWLELEVRARDPLCVYCGIPMVTTSLPGHPRSLLATWEHIINNASIVTQENIALCCCSCNASKGAKALDTWIDSQYCKRKGITRDTVAQVVKNAFRSAID